MANWTKQMGFWLCLQSGDVLSAIEVCTTLEHTISFWGPWLEVSAYKYF